jgi:hypothetical protein
VPWPSQWFFLIVAKSPGALLSRDRDGTIVNAFHHRGHQ